MIVIPSIAQGFYKLVKARRIQPFIFSFQLLRRIFCSNCATTAFSSLFFGKWSLSVMCGKMKASSSKHAVAYCPDPKSWFALEPFLAVWVR